MSRRTILVDYPEKELQKYESIEISYQGTIDVILGWDDLWDDSKQLQIILDDADLCVFYKTKTGEVGGVFPNEYSQKHTEGSLVQFPFIFRMGEERLYPKYQCEEIIRIARLHEMKELYIVAIDYHASVENETGFGAPVTLETVGTDPLIKINYSRNSYEQGSILLLAVLEEKCDGSLVITNKSKLMTMSEAFDSIPGFATIVTA